MAKKARIIVLILALLGGSIWGYYQYFNSQSASIEASGTIEATTVEIAVRAPGILESLALQEGAEVKQDQVVAVLTRSDLEAQKERDAMGVLAAQAKLDDLKSGARSQEIKEAASNVNIAQTNLDKANRDLQRAESLFKEGALSQENLDQAKANASLKKYQLEAAEAHQNLLESGNRPQQITAAAAELARNKAVLQASESVLADLQLKSPISGIVLSRNYEPGEFVQLGASLGTIADLNRMWIKVYIATDDLPAIKLGQQVHFTVSGDQSTYSGKVSHIASRGEFTPKTIQTQKERSNVVFAVKIAVNNNPALKIGMPADVVFDQGKAR